MRADLVGDGCLTRWFSAHVLHARVCAAPPSERRTWHDHTASLAAGVQYMHAYIQARRGYFWFIGHYRCVQRAVSIPPPVSQ